MKFHKRCLADRKRVGVGRSEVRFTVVDVPIALQYEVAFEVLPLYLVFFFFFSYQQAGQFITFELCILVKLGINRVEKDCFGIGLK